MWRTATTKAAAAVNGNAAAVWRTSSRAIATNPLFRLEGYINGKWVTAKDGSVFSVYNPATQEEIAQVADFGVTETKAAIEAAKEAWHPWRSKASKERSQILRKWYDEIMSHKEELAQLITTEQGKPLEEARGEVVYAASYVEWFAEEAKRIYGDIIPANVPGRRIHVLKQPVGVCALITPWNFPIGMGTRKIAPALAAGCTVVLKPSEDTPLSSIALARLAERAGVPAGVINVVPCSRAHTAQVGGELTSSPDVRKISFTGSTAVGKMLMQQCASTVKRVSLELGGNAPFIVFEDADLDHAVQGALASKFRNMGQTCVCANRIMVQDTVYDEFAEKFRMEVEKMRVGNGLESGIQQGPLINEAAVKKVAEHIADAVNKGAKVICGGKPHQLGGNFFEPTIITGINENMLLAQQETFGPVAPLLRFHDEDEAIQMANSSRAGLAGYFYTRDYARVHRVAEALECGIVGLNEGIISTEVAPFGGWKESGLGREGSKYGVDEYIEIKYLCIGQVDVV